MTIKPSAAIFVIFCSIFFSARWNDLSSIPQNLVGKWTVVEFHAVQKNAFPNQGIASLQIELDGMTTGFIGCNRMRTNCTINEYHIQFGTILTTRKFCKKEYMDVEDRMKEILSSSTRYHINKNVLTLYADKRKLITLIKE